MKKSEYDRNYMKQHCKQIKLQLNVEKDKDIVDFLAEQDNVNGFLKELVRNYMKKERTE